MYVLDTLKNSDIAILSGEMSQDTRLAFLWSKY